MKKNEIKCVIFDMDGVITSSSDEHFKAWGILINKLGCELDHTVEVYTRGVSRMRSLDIILESVGLKDKFSDEEKIKMATEKNENYVKLISAFTQDNLYEGMYEILCELKDRGIKIALGSASKNGPLLLEKMGITSFFDYVVDPSSVKNSKPAPDIFLKAAEELGFSSDECIGVEDAKAGVEAIKAANMFAVGIGDKDILKDADIVYQSVKDIRLSDFL